jgi:hypothetical protein
MSPTVLAECADVQLSDLTGGNLPDQDAQRVSDILKAAQLLRQETRLPIAWNLVPVVRPILKAKIAEMREAENPLLAQVYLVRLGLTNYFEHVEDGHVIVVEQERKAALFPSFEKANEVVTALKQLHVRAQVVNWDVNLFRQRDTVQTLESVGL